MALRLPHPPNLPSLAKALAIAAAHQSGFVNPIKRFHGPPEGMQLGMMGRGPVSLLGGVKTIPSAGTAGRTYRSLPRNYEKGEVAEKLFGMSNKDMKLALALRNYKPQGIALNARRAKPRRG